MEKNLSETGFASTSEGGKGRWIAPHPKLGRIRNASGNISSTPNLGGNSGNKFDDAIVPLRLAV
jgi:hypothetical protein